MRQHKPRLGVAIGSILAATSLLIGGCSSSGGGTKAASGPMTQADIDKAMNTPTTITFWSWLPDIQNEVNLFQKKYPKIKVNYTNAGQGGTEYTKLRTVIKANSGQPDVSQVEFQYISSFQSDLADLTPYGAVTDLKPQFVPSIWKQVANPDGVFGIPQDFGPMGNLYRSDIYAKAGLKAGSTTWDQYMADAKTLKAKTGSLITDLPGNDGGEFLALMWQAGARPFGYDGKKTVTVNLESAASKQVVDFWQKMLDQNLVGNEPDFANNWYQGLANGKYAGWLVAAWGPDNLTGAVAKTSGKWTATALPQWTPDHPASGFWGGSSDAVLKSSKHQIAAYELAKFLNTDPESSLLEATSSQELYPPFLPTLNSPKFVDQKNAFFNGQQVNKLFTKIAATVDPNFGWLPYMDFAYTTYTSTLGKAIADKTSLEAGLAAWQSALVTYGKQQGFTVKTTS